MKQSDQISRNGEITNRASLLIKREVEVRDIICTLFTLAAQTGVRPEVHLLALRRSLGRTGNWLNGNDHFAHERGKSLVRLDGSQLRARAHSPLINCAICKGPSRAGCQVRRGVIFVLI